MKYTAITFMRLASAALLISALAGCASVPRIHALYDREADFSDYKTYGYAEQLGIDGGDYTTLLAKYLKNATSRELEKHGYAYSENPDLLVNFYVSSREKFDVHGAQFGASYYHFRSAYGPWPYYAYETRVQQYTQGTLNIDLVDAEKKQLVWEGVAIGRVPRDILDHLESEISQTVTMIFERYPFTAGSNVRAESP